MRLSLAKHPELLQINGTPDLLRNISDLLMMAEPSQIPQLDTDTLCQSVNVLTMLMGGSVILFV